MRKFSGAAFALSLLLSAVAAFAAPPKAAKSVANTAPGTVVIVFKDGHRQTFNLADIAQIEFPSADKQVAGTVEPSRGRFLGKWEVGDGNGGTFFITIKEDGDAYRSLHEIHGKWAYVNGEAQITWDDGAMDAIRKTGGKFQKYAYSSGKAFTDAPDNVTSARNTSPRPI